MASARGRYFIEEGQRLISPNSVDLLAEVVQGGGFGVIVIGHDRLLAGRIAVLKTFNPDVFASDPTILDLFTREALVWVGLWPHPNILRAIALTRISTPGVINQPYLYLEYAEGGNLRRQLWQGHFDLLTALRWSQHLAAGLAAMHHPDPELNRPDPLIHRDLKPENLLLSGGLLKITDLGLAKVLTGARRGGASASADAETSQLQVPAALATSNPALVSAGMPSLPTAVYPTVTTRAGSPQYMAPEQFRGEEPTEAVDIYAMGVIMAEMLGGVYPFRLQAGWRWEQIHQQEPRRLTKGPQGEMLPPNLESVVRACLANEAGKRPRAEQVREGLGKIAKQLGQQPYQPIMEARTAEMAAIVWSNWASAFDRVGFKVQALSAYERALAYDSTKVQSWYGIAGTLNDLGRYVGALSAYEQALARNPTDPNFWHGKGKALVYLGRYTEALDAFEQALTLDSSDPVFWHGKAMALLDLHRYKEALDAYEEALARRPYDVSAWSGKGYVLRLLGRNEEALLALEQALAYREQELERNPNDPNVWHGKGNDLVDLGRYEEALSAYEQAVDRDSTNPDFWFDTGNALFGLGRYEEALGAYNQALAYNPADPLNWNGKGNALNLLGRYEEALSAYEEVLARDPDLVPALLSKADVLSDRLHRSEEALSLYQRVMQLDPTEAFNWRNLADGLANLGRYAEALHAAQQSLVLEPENPIGYLRLATALSGLGRDEEALSAYARSDQEDADVWKGRAAVLRRLGREAEAQAAEARAREL